ncbi:hypothetical protein IEQ34_011221 [Dendrobium chrysotoxum]|uniref:Uncharacterized protein n=1 Tax=Dendrobium chrysotoxum TaxID=161865 RepID=A0AAV7GY42_DENCH|nr:hypothetical protein IEQ34_011221 [Dendrobium chrysotoxum]
MEKIKSDVEKRFSSMEGRFSTVEGRLSSIENCFEKLEDMMKKMIEIQSKASLAIPTAKPNGKEILQEMMRKLMEMQSKTPSMISIANPNQDSIGIPLVEFEGKEIEWEEFDQESTFHQEPPPRATIRGGIVFPNGGTARREFCDGGGGVTGQYGRFFW